MKRLKLLFLTLAIVPILTFAHGPSRQKVIEEITMNAPPDKVWSLIRGFCSIQDWHPEIKSCSTDKGSDIGSVRTIELQNGEKIKEKLFKLDNEKRLVQYAMQLEKGRVIKGLPIATHGSTMIVVEADGGTVVQWKGAFYRSFPGQEPPPELSDAAGIEAISMLYKTGLEGIKAAAEK